MILASVVVWLLVEIDKEIDSGYEWIIMIDGYKVFEEYDCQCKDGKVSIIVEDWYIIIVEGWNIEEGVLCEVFDVVSIDKLKGLEQKCYLDFVAFICFKMW